MKIAHFHPQTLEFLRTLDETTRREFGSLIRDLQRGALLTMPRSKTMGDVAAGVSELRFSDGSGTYRVFYYLKIKDAVVIFHGFIKKSQKTPRKEIEMAKRRLKEIQNALQN